MYLILNKKSPYYQLVYFNKGNRTTISTGKRNKREAEKFLASFNPRPVRNKPEPKQISVSLSKFVAEYKVYVGNIYSESYLKKAVVPSFNRLEAFVGNKTVKDISPKDMDLFVSTVIPKARYAAALYYKTLKAAFNKAVSWNYMKENPMAHIKPPRIPKSYPLFISEAEFILIINKSETQLHKDIFTTAFYTGMRLNEILNMTWDWIDLKQKMITVKNSRNFKSKSKRERVIPIHNKIRKIFLRRMSLENKNYVFYRICEIKLNGNFISKKFKKAVRGAKLNDNYHFHSLRHSFASTLAQRGVSLYTIKELLGHKDIKTTQIYSHLTSDNLSRAVNML